MITISQGASKLLTSTITDDDGNVVDPSGVYNITLELLPENSRKVIVKYSVLTLTGYGEITVDAINKTIKVYVDGDDTASFPPGRIIGKFSVIDTNALYESGYQTLISQGVIFNVIP